MKLTPLILLFVSLSIQSCAQMQVESPVFNQTIKGLLSGTVNQVDFEMVKTEIESNQVIFLDARERAEYDVSHIPNAIWVGYNDFDIERLKNIDKNKKVIVYCSVGYRSEKVGEKLQDMGYSNIFNFYGGIFEWVNQNGQLINSEGETHEIHGYDAKWALFLQRGEVVID